MWLSLNQVDLFGAGHFVGARQLRAAVARSGVRHVAGQHVRSHADDRAGADGDRAARWRWRSTARAGGAAIFRGIFFSSAVLSVTIVTLIWRFMLAPDAGLLGYVVDRRSARSRCPSSATRISFFRRSRSRPSGGRSASRCCCSSPGCSKSPRTCTRPRRSTMRAAGRPSGASPCRRCGGRSCWS